VVEEWSCWELFLDFLAVKVESGRIFVMETAAKQIVGKWEMDAFGFLIYHK
jgi:hypothetical protein